MSHPDYLRGRVLNVRMARYNGPSRHILIECAHGYCINGMDQELMRYPLDLHREYRWIVFVSSYAKSPGGHLRVASERDRDTPDRWYINGSGYRTIVDLIPRLPFHAFRFHSEDMSPHL